MPIFDDKNETKPLTTPGGFKFSAINISALKASEYTLVGFAVDVSGSISGFEPALQGCVRESLLGCQKSPRADNMLVRFSVFSDLPRQVHGFKHLNDCDAQSYASEIVAGGCTSLFDAAADMVESLAIQGGELTASEYTTNAILIVMTDGEDNKSKLTPGEVRKAVALARSSERLESILTILVGVGVGNPRLDQYLDKFNREAGFDQYIKIEDVTPKSFAKLAGFITQSVSSQSQHLATGTGSQPIQF